MAPLLVALIVMVLVVVGGLVAVIAFARQSRRLLAAERQETLRDLERQRAADREATAEVLRSVVAEHGGTVESAVQTILAVAGDKLADQSTAGAQALDLRQQAIDVQVQAVTGELHQVRELVESLKRQGASHHGELSQALADAARHQEALNATTTELRQALASPKARGQWGERMAEDVLRASGLREGINYRKQTAIAGGTVPDFSFFMPEGLLLNMDVKFPIDNYLRFLGAENPGEADQFCAAFAKDVRQRVKEITTRDYIDPERTVDSVLLFIPNESVYSFIHEHDPGVADLALQHRVVLCSPFTLFAVLGIVRHAMDQFLLERTSDEILRSLGGLGNEWTKFTDQLDKVGRAVDTLHRSYDALNGTRRRSFEKRLDEIESIRERRGIDDASTFHPADADLDIPGTVHLLADTGTG
jgi:DNA recombination protein RmuC